MHVRLKVYKTWSQNVPTNNDVLLVWTMVGTNLHRCNLQRWCSCWLLFTVLDCTGEVTSETVLMKVAHLEKVLSTHRSFFSLRFRCVHWDLDFSEHFNCQLASLHQMFRLDIKFLWCEIFSSLVMQSNDSLW